MADADALRDAAAPGRMPAAAELIAQAPPTAPLTPASAPPAEEKVMTLVDHLSELRNRIFICIGAVVLGSGVGFYFSGQLISLLKGPLLLDPNGQERVLRFLAPGEAFFIYVKL